MNILCLLGYHNNSFYQPGYYDDFIYVKGWLTEYTLVKPIKCDRCGKLSEVRESYVTFINFGKKLDDQTIEDIQNMQGVYVFNNYFWEDCLRRVGKYLRNDDPAWYSTYMDRYHKKWQQAIQRLENGETVEDVLK